MPAIEIGDQLPYTPVHKVFFNVEPSYRDFTLSLDASYTGPTTGINEDLESYFVIDLSLEKQFRQDGYAGSITLELGNLTDTSYRVIERRPMPGLNFRLGCMMAFGNKRTE